MLRRILPILLVVLGCAPGPLKITYERRMTDTWWGGLSSRIVTGSTLASGEGLLAVATGRGTVYARRTSDGGLVWKAKVLGGVDMQPLLVHGKIFVGTDKGKFYGLDAKDGRELWHGDIAGGILGGVSLAGEGLILFCANDGYLYAVDETAGTVRWRYGSDLPSRITVAHYPAPLGAGQEVYAAFSSGTVVALKPGDGSEIWNRNFQERERFSDIGSLVVLGDGNLVAVHFLGSVQALARKDGSTLWSIPGGAGFARPVEFNGLLLLPMDRNQVAAVDAKNGSRVWTFDPGRSATWSGLTMVGRDLWASTFEGDLYLVDGAGGGLRWRYHLGAPVQGAPIPADDRVWTLTRKGTLFGLEYRHPS